MDYVAAASEYFERIGRCVKFDEGNEREEEDDLGRKRWEKNRKDKHKSWGRKKILIEKSDPKAQIFDST